MNAKRRGGIVAGCLVGAIGATLLALTAYSGYFGGDVFVPIPATKQVPPQHPRIAAVYVAGDIGIKLGMGPDITRRLAAAGIPVVGVNSTAYFNKRRAPAEISALIADAAQRALMLGKADRIVLIGHSYGADMLQVAYSGLTPALRAKVAAVGLIVPTDDIYLRISPFEMLGWSRPDMPASTIVHNLDRVPVLCIYGREETSSPCAAFNGPVSQSVALPGGHGLHQDTVAVATILNARIARITNLSLAAKPPLMPAPLSKSAPRR